MSATSEERHAKAHTELDQMIADYRSDIANSPRGAEPATDLDEISWRIFQNFFGKGVATRDDAAHLCHWLGAAIQRLGDQPWVDPTGFPTEMDSLDG